MSIKFIEKYVKEKKIHRYQVNSIETRRENINPNKLQLAAVNQAVSELHKNYVIEDEC